VADGEVPYDVLLAASDPGLVKMELDLAWARGGNADIIGYFRRWPGRFPMVHLKDYNAGNESDIGTGDVAFDTILAHAELAGIEHGFVERDHPADPAAALQKNYQAVWPIWSRYVESGVAG
jgi:sugar phosphate isomerase/epimerase